MPSLPDRPKRRRNETRDLVEPIVVALNGLAGVRIFRPIVLNKMVRHMSGAGLSIGSADLVGMITLKDVLHPWTMRTTTAHRRVADRGPIMDIARFFALEVKWPGKKPTDDQDAWATVVRNLGGFCATVHSVDEALLAVDRCRRGDSE